MKQINFATVESVVNKGIELLKTGDAKIEFGQLTKVKIDHNGRHLENKMTTSLISAIELKGDKAIEIDLTAMFKQSGDGIDNESIKERRAILIKISFIKAVLRTVITLYNAVAALEDLFRSSIANLKELAKSGVLIVDPIRDLKKIRHARESKQFKHANSMDEYLWDVSSPRAKAGSIRLLSFIRSGYVTAWVTGNTVELFSHDSIAYLDEGVAIYAYPTSDLKVTRDYVKFTASPELVKKIIAYNKKYAKDLRQSKLDHAYQALSDYVIEHKIPYDINLRINGKWYIDQFKYDQTLFDLLRNCGIHYHVCEDYSGFPGYARIDKIQPKSFIAKVWKGHKF